MSDAFTRRLTSGLAGRSSFEKIEFTCFSTARFVNTRDSAIAPLLFPVAICASTSRSRAVSHPSRELAARRRAWMSTSTDQRVDH